MTSVKRLTATLREGPHGYIAAHTDSAEQHLKVIYLERWAVRSGKLGDRVEMEYRRIAGGGHGWIVTQVLS